MRRLLYLAVAIGAIALIALEVETADSGGAKQAPALPKQALQGPPATLATLQGKPALIDFWASWCEPCREEAPEIARLQRSLAGSAAIVGIDYTDRHLGPPEIDANGLPRGHEPVRNGLAVQEGSDGMRKY